MKTTLTREQKVERILAAALEQVKKMVEEGRSQEDIIRFNQMQLEAAAAVK